MANHSKHIEQAFLVSLERGVVELRRDWVAMRMPPVSFEGSLEGYLQLEALTSEDYAKESRYYQREDGRIVFVFDPTEYPAIDYERIAVYLAGPFNEWSDALGEDRWKLGWMDIQGRRVLGLAVAKEAIASSGAGVSFKFVTEKGHWLPVDLEAPNVAMDGGGNWNYQFFMHRTGRHRFAFEFEKPIDLSENNYLLYHTRKGVERYYISPGKFFFGLSSDKELGAIVSAESTTFRIFAPRAKWVKVGYFPDLSKPDHAHWVLMEKGSDFVWEAAIAENLDGAYYWFKIDGPDGHSSLFDPDRLILDPYAKASVSREGPGIIVGNSAFALGEMRPFAPPSWQDLIILECHTRDLVANEVGEREAPAGFADLTTYAKRDDFYPVRLGVNAIELQPVQDHAAQSYGDYHWGYMTANFFSPASMYASAPEKASQIAEFREFVDTAHARGLAVILDVVYNHVGEPAHLMYVDKLYYFHEAADGSLTNWSGCGNDFRSDAAMAKRLIIESLAHFVTAFGVDGFRFDLADLVGKPVLQAIERELKAIRPNIILIAEPWSFRGHIGMELRDTGYASWNDGYREFVRKYVLDNGNQAGLTYYLKGSPDYYATWPAQTVNYVESHDDRVWIDNITENPNHDGTSPTLSDVRRTHLMVATLMMSIGIPMLHAGMDMLRSKGGKNNTYLDGQANALDYTRGWDFPATQKYFQDWIAFRKSPLGSLLRLYSPPGDSYFSFLYPPDSDAVICLYNADLSKGPEQLLFAINPETFAIRQSLGAFGGGVWRQCANRDSFVDREADRFRNDARDALYLPPISCGLWTRTMS